jgi:hypothetical protein
VAGFGIAANMIVAILMVLTRDTGDGGIPALHAMGLRDLYTEQPKPFAMAPICPIGSNYRSPGISLVSRAIFFADALFIGWLDYKNFTIAGLPADAKFPKNGELHNEFDLRRTTRSDPGC